MSWRTTLQHSYRTAVCTVMRCTSEVSDDKHLWPQDDVDSLHGFAHKAIERIQMIGVTSVPLKQLRQAIKGPTQTAAQKQRDLAAFNQKLDENQPTSPSAEGLLFHVMGQYSHPVVLLDDRRVRPYAMKEGESAFYAASGTGQMVLHTDKATYTVAVDNPPEQSQSSEKTKRFASSRHVNKQKQSRVIKDGETPPEPHHEGETVNTETRHQEQQIEHRDADARVAVYDRPTKSWTHRILSGNADAGAGAGVMGQLSGMLGQMQGLVSGGVGLPGIQGIGSLISGMTSQITGAGGDAGLASSIAATGDSISSGAMGGMGALLTSLTSQLGSLSGMLNPGAMMSEVLHSHVLDKAKGILASAFQGQHTTTWDQNGITHASAVKITHTAPQIDHNGTVNMSNILHVTTGIVSPYVNPPSDARLKDNIKDHPSVLDKVMALKLKTYDVHDVDMRSGWVSSRARSSLGLVAQDVREVFPQLVHEGKFLTLEEGKVGLLVLAAFQEFVAEVRSELAELKKGP